METTEGKNKNGQITTQMKTCDAHTLQITIFNLCTCTSDIESGDYELRMQKEQRNIELDTHNHHTTLLPCVITFGVRENGYLYRYVCVYECRFRLCVREFSCVYRFFFQN